MKNQMANKNIKEIHQFLLDNDFESTAEILIQEASKMGFQNLKLNKVEEIVDPYAQLILHYNTGNYSTFFQLWNDLFSDNIKQCEEYKKLTFYLHVHFAVLPKRKLYADRYKERGVTSEISTLELSPMKKDLISEKSNEDNISEIEKNINNSMKQLQDYLNEGGKELEHDPELQTFYALPFIEDIYTDTFFSKILDQDWLDELSKNLDSFITRHKQDLIDLKYVNFNKVQLQNSAQIDITIPATKTITTELDSTQNKIKKGNVPIVSNDRDIPIFLEDHADEEQYDFNKRSFTSKNTQTHITGNQITINNMRESTFNSGESINNLLKMHKTDERLIQYSRELVLTKSDLCKIHTSYERLKLKFHKLYADYRKLLDVAGELTMALENSVKGQNVDVQRTLEICQKIFPDLFNQNMGETSYPSLLQLDRVDIKTTALPKLDIAAMPVSPKLLDYKKIKLHLINGDVKTKLLLLQALRWKITLSQSTKQDEVLHEYVNHDLLGLHGQITSDNGKSILSCLLTAGEAYARHLLQQFTARLLNTLASFKCGRDYLSVGPIVINVTFACLDNNYADGMDPFACDMMIAMLQKLSLRRQQRIYMIESGLLEWIINHLHHKCRIISLYRLEYATALLLNLSLHRLAQARASKMSSLLVSTLLILLSLDHTPSLPYINGALNNFLRHPIINEEARKIKRSNILEYLGSNHKITETRKHLDHMLKIQRQENVNTPQNDETEDDDNEDLNVLESELDENDPLQNYIGELNGETLLAICYSVSSKTPQKAVNTDTALHQISTLDSIDFCNANHRKSHICNKYPSYLALRINTNKDQQRLLIQLCRLEDKINRRQLQNGKFRKTGFKKLSIETMKSFKQNFSERILKDTIYLYENQTSKNSSETAVTSSTILISGHENDQAEIEKFSSIASLNNNNNNSNIINDVSWKNDSELAKEEEEAFLAKPKLSRTPP